MSCSNFREGIKPAGRLEQTSKFGIYGKYDPQTKPKIREQKALLKERLENLTPIFLII